MEITSDSALGKLIDYFVTHSQEQMDKAGENANLLIRAFVIGLVTRHRLDKLDLPGEMRKYPFVKQAKDELEELIDETHFAAASQNAGDEQKDDQEDCYPETIASLTQQFMNAHSVDMRGMSAEHRRIVRLAFFSGLLYMKVSAINAKDQKAIDAIGKLQQEIDRLAVMKSN